MNELKRGRKPDYSKNLRSKPIVKKHALDSMGRTYFTWLSPAMMYTQHLQYYLDERYITPFKITEQNYKELGLDGYIDKDRGLVIKGCKGFESDWSCRGKQYACQGDFSEETPVNMCANGIHFSPTIYDVFRYYPLSSTALQPSLSGKNNKSRWKKYSVINNFKYAEVEAWGEMETILSHDTSSPTISVNKICAEHIRVCKDLSGFVLETGWFTVHEYFYNDQNATASTFGNSSIGNKGMSNGFKRKMGIQKWMK